MKKPFTPSRLTIAMVACVPMMALADDSEPSVQLEAMNITIKRDNTTLKESAQKVLIISRADIENQLLINDDTTQALSRLIPGYSPASEKMGTVGESFRGRDVLFMIDGVPQSNPLRDGSREARTIDLSMVDRIEVVYGASAEQGLGATGGVINFVTKSNRKDGVHQKLSLGVNSGYKLNSTGLGYNARYEISGGSEKFDGLFGAKYNKEGMYYGGDGRLMGTYGNQGDIMDSHSYDVFAKGSYHIDEDKTATLSANYYHLEGSRDYVNVAGNRATGYTDTSRKRGDSAEDVASRGENPYNDVLTVNASFEDRGFFGTKLTAQAYYQDFAARYGTNNAANYQDPAITTIGQLYDQSQNESTKIGAKLTVNKDDLWEDKLSITAGVDVLQDKTKQDLIRYNRAWAPQMTYRNVAPFVQARVKLFDRLSVNAGVRYEDGELKVDDFSTLAGYTRANSFGARRYTATPVAGGKVSFGETLKSAGLIYDVTPKWQAYASYSEGFGLPDVGGTLRAITALNRSVNTVGLEPIITDNVEAGVRFSGDKLSLDVSGYQSKSDLGSTLEYDNTVQGYRAVRQKTKVKGAEAVISYRPNPNYTISANYAYTDGKYDALGNGVMVDMPARNVSPAKAGLRLDHRLPDGKSTVGLSAMHYFAKDYPDVVAGNVSYPSRFSGYTLVDFSYAQPLGKGTLGFGINNLLNEDYVNYLTEAVLVSGADARYSSGRGRNYTISYSFDF